MARQGYEWSMRNSVYNEQLSTKRGNIWRPKLPLKIKIFLWLVYQNRVLTKCYRSKWAPTASMVCALCANDEETSEHLFCTCSSRKSFGTSWNESQLLGFRSIEQLGKAAYSLTGPKDKSIAGEVKCCLVPTGLWAIWMTRNTIIFRGQCFYFENLWETFSGLVQDWGTLLGGARRVELNQHGLSITA
ncbi:hypothetical protein QJS10_CPA03g01636 [Acorus calamus]|uniref:Reverse transcriptase zinc-binding domain-containing protein n=1 Tax=Acorus calamus TaxID=4465 RepID=A0AAV9F907_ACOCL|nr:hypothetical protein QJS10_CPA03g01636 [Acorus calamus]